MLDAQMMEPMLSLSAAALSFNGALPAVRSQRARGAVMETKEDLKALANELNPVVGFWDPLDLSSANFWGQGEEATIGFLREAEIKHGRISMFAFVGFIVHANGIRTPIDQIAMGVPTGLSAPATWDAIPESAKLQIVLFVGLMELWRENKAVLAGDGEKHYMKGGKPGYFPSFELLPHPVPFTLFDPFNLSKDKTPEAKAKGLVKEINNGRLAMLGIMGFVSESAVPGSVPLLKGVLPAYSGEVMAPFASNIFTQGLQM